MPFIPLARLRSLWRSLRGYSAIDAEMSEEFRHHLELRAADLIREGLPSAEAHRRARLEFGSAERYKAEGRESRGLRRVDSVRFSWLDFKLGFRMLVKYPGLTIIGGLAMAFAIWVGAAAFEIMTRVLNPTLPLEGGGRIVGLRVWDAKANDIEPRIGHDFLIWRHELTSVEELGAFRESPRNLILRDGVGEPISVVEISASAFRVARTPPLLGRTIVAADETEGAPPVVVISHDLWQRRFAGDPDIVGRTVRVGRTQSTVVGVMPPGFAFPVDHDFWIPLRNSALDPLPRSGSAIRVFARLKPRVSIEEARTELVAVGRRIASDLPASHEHLRPEILPYGLSLFQLSWVEKAILMSLNVPMLMLLVLICGNVALLMFARAATRETELAVRTALGASRGRIIMQLFAEALVLGSIATAIGLMAATRGLQWVMRIIEIDMLEGKGLPFWIQPELSPITILYAIGLTVLGAVIAGVVPALKVTRGMGTSLQRASAGSGGMKFGGIWTAVIVSQIAVTVAFPFIALSARKDSAQVKALSAGFPAGEYLALRVEMDREPPPGTSRDTSRAAFLARYRATVDEVERRLESEPTVAGVTFAEHLPMSYHQWRMIELDEGGGAPLNPEYPEGYRVSDAKVAIDYLDVLASPVVMGRGFHAGDLEESVVTVIVNQSFANNVLGGRNPIGRRFRYIGSEEQGMLPRAERGRWYEIVGVAPDLAMAKPHDPKVAGIYHPASPSAIYPAQVAVRVRGNPDSFIPRLRAIAAEVDPTARLYDVERLERAKDGELQSLSFWFRLFAGVSIVALILSLAGIYAVMSFAVAKRTREIGIRIALGAGQRRIFVAVFKRPIIQVALGIVAGAGLLMIMSSSLVGANLTTKGVVVIIGYSACMMLVCMLACIVPTMRALRIEPTEALRGDA
jgi:predicted permease